MPKTADEIEDELRELQIGLVKYQTWAMDAGQKALILLEGRDAAGKDGSIRRIVDHMAPRNTRVVALPKPSDRERSEWYFQRYVEHLPAAGEVVIFNRSWYNRAGVEPVMSFCTPQQHEAFLHDAPNFEHMLIKSGIHLIKLWLDISKEEQAERLDQRRTDPLKALKVSPLDAEAQKRWDAYSAARDEMLARTHTDFAPWTIVRADKKKKARPAIIRLILSRLAPKKIAGKAGPPDSDIVFTFEPAALNDGRLAR
jgi:polyphosphate kinase 2